jgi:putative membrane protein
MLHTMNTVAEIALIVDAVILVCVAPIEMFFLDRPWAKRFLGVEFTKRSDVELWAFCVGARNLLGAAGVFVGAWMLHAGDPDAGLVVLLVAAWYLLLSSLAMAVADLLGKWHPRGGSVVGTVSSSVLPLLAIVVQAVWG